MKKNQTIIKTASSLLPTKYGTFELSVYLSPDKKEHSVLLKRGQMRKPMLTRLHSQCLTGDTLMSLKCDCGEQLRQSMKLIQKEDNGIILYLNQEGRGIGLTNKIRAYRLQEEGLDTVEANEALGFRPDERDYAIAADILNDLNIKNIILITNNPVKQEQLENNGINVVATVPLEVKPNAKNTSYLRSKKQKMGHKLNLV